MHLCECLIFIFDIDLLRKSNMSFSNKIFFIGFNKTGTTTYHSIFEKVVKSVHSSGWPSQVQRKNWQYLKKYECFSDGECVDYEILDKRFPASKFILNTRGLYDWIMSRIKHIYRIYPKMGKGRMAREWNNTKDKEAVIIKWIKKRNEYYKKCMDYFKNRDNFIILNICDERLIEKLKEISGLELDEKFKTKNIRKNMKFKDFAYWNEIILNAFKKLNVEKKDYNSDEYLKNVG